MRLGICLGNAPGICVEFFVPSRDSRYRWCVGHERLQSSCTSDGRQGSVKQAKPAASVSPSPNAEDMRIARQAMNVEDVLRMLKRGDSQEAIIEQVRKRHLTQKIVEAQELELSLMGSPSPIAGRAEKQQ